MDYMERLFAKIGKKKTESYVIGRIWHQLDDDRVKFVVQQYIRRKEDKYALADLYLPQLNILVEINEPFHEGNKEVDRVRNEEIVDRTHYDLRVIRCGFMEKDAAGKDVIRWNSLEDIHRQIAEVVAFIKQRITQMGDSFKPLDDVSMLSVEYHRNKGYLKVEDNECLRTTDDVAAVFGTRPKHRGYRRASGAAVPNKKDEIVWWPASGHSIWHNELIDDGMYIYEYPIAEGERAKHLKQWLDRPGHTRVTFLRGKDDLGFCFYRFVGVFQLDREKSMQKGHCVWRRIADTYQLDKGDAENL